MNNQNDLSDNEPDPRGGWAGVGDGHQWNYPLLVGLAAFGWIWKRELQRETQEVRAQYKIKTSEMEKQLHEEREDCQFQRANATLKELEYRLLERQNAYCSPIRPQCQRLEMEKNMLIKFVKDPDLAELNLESDLKDIFKRDTHCADLLNSDNRQNGSLMWKYLKHWQDTVQKRKRAEGAILGGKI
ncbi:hypothetical protein CgunFtcFv8_012234 [Champsocephalus gunnari]|uniref:Coiled-coil domain-containing protein 127 n=1 Tax=Champsocephalus gunnari TaxID=52237 RepID=A0AAN8D9G5_CHAGU|nr:hypothetical protein CgunFtcFv8_012234 [Champsocephalus gunnari]